MNKNPMGILTVRLAPQQVTHNGARVLACGARGIRPHAAWRVPFTANMFLGMALPEFTFTHDGRTFRCRVDMQGETAAGIARPSHAVWRVDVDGTSHAPFDASPEDTVADIERRVTDWFDGIHRTPHRRQ